MAIIDINKLVKIYDGNSLEVQALRGGPGGREGRILRHRRAFRVRQNDASEPDRRSRPADSAGSITVAGMDLTGMSAKELSDLRLNKIGFIFQAYNLIPVLTALENVEYILLLQGVDREERARRSTRDIERGGPEQGDRPPSQGALRRPAAAGRRGPGHRVRAGHCPGRRAHGKPGPENRASLIDLMHGLNHEKNITFIFSTHDGHGHGLRGAADTVSPTARSFRTKKRKAAAKAWKRKPSGKRKNNRYENICYLFRTCPICFFSFSCCGLRRPGSRRRMTALPVTRKKSSRRKTMKNHRH